MPDFIDQTFLLFVLMTAVTSGLLWFARKRGVE